MLLIGSGCVLSTDSDLDSKYATTRGIQTEFDRRMNVLVDNARQNGNPSFNASSISYYEAEGRTMQKLLDEAGEAVCQRELKRLSNEHVDFKLPSFDKRLLGQLIDRYCARGDFSTLRVLLAANCPPDSGILADLAGMKEPEGMLVLVSAYYAAERATAHTIVAQLRLAFDSWQKPGDSDSEFVHLIDVSWRENYLKYEIDPNSPLYTQSEYRFSQTKSDLFKLKVEPPRQP